MSIFGIVLTVVDIVLASYIAYLGFNHRIRMWWLIRQNNKLEAKLQTAYEKRGLSFIVDGQSFSSLGQAKKKSNELFSIDQTDTGRKFLRVLPSKPKQSEQPPTDDLYEESLAEVEEMLRNDRCQNQ